MPTFEFVFIAMQAAWDLGSLNGYGHTSDREINFVGNELAQDATTDSIHLTEKKNLENIAFYLTIAAKQDRKYNPTFRKSTIRSVFNCLAISKLK